MSKSERNKYNRELINEARKRMAEKYGDEYREDDSE
jgi:YidC/Oxa1 family membrane protein insertase